MKQTYEKAKFVGTLPAKRGWEVIARSNGDKYGTTCTALGPASEEQKPEDKKEVPA